MDGGTLHTTLQSHALAANNRGGGMELPLRRILRSVQVRNTCRTFWDECGSERNIGFAAGGDR